MATSGEKIHRWRAQRALTQVELAEAAGMTQTAIWRIESGTTKPRPTTIRKLAEALGVTTMDLVGDQDGKAAGDGA